MSDPRPEKSLSAKKRVSGKASPLLQRIISGFTEGYKLPRIAAAVSGGCDSVALLLSLNELRRIRHFELCVFHVDHSLRSSSEEDRKWVEQLAAELGLPFYYRKATNEDKQSPDSGHKAGSEAWARWFRYKCFAEMLKESNAEAIATGHNSDDQAETVVMRLIRGCGAAGAAGIKSRITLKTKSGRLKMWRPLLLTKRSDLKAYLQSIGQTWREDETNATENYFRNRIRHNILPILKNAGNNVNVHISNFAEEISEMHSYLRSAAARFLSLYSDGQSLNVEKIPAKALRLEAIRQWLIALGLESRADRALILAINGLWTNKTGGKCVKAGDQVFQRRKKQIIASGERI